jgi:phage repressor protein C with HTH and peptisase S24 domain
MKPSHLLRFASAVLAVLGAAQTPALASFKHAFQPRSNVAYQRAVLEASLVALQREGRFVAQIDGASMLPFFGPDSVAVVQRITPDRLRVGMIAVYENAAGEKVAHRVVEQTPAGWRVQGHNNPRADSTLVTGANLLGVVYATFHTAGRPRGGDLSTFPLPVLPTLLGAPAK